MLLAALISTVGLLTAAEALMAMVEFEMMLKRFAACTIALELSVKLSFACIDNTPEHVIPEFVPVMVIVVAVQSNIGVKTNIAALRSTMVVAVKLWRPFKPVLHALFLLKLSKTKLLSPVALLSVKIVPAGPGSPVPP